MKFDNYIAKVLSLLTCNTVCQGENISYEYSELQVKDNLEYFERCMNRGLSPYKALIFFNPTYKTTNNYRDEFLWCIVWIENKEKKYAYYKDNIYAQNLVWNKWKKDYKPICRNAEVFCKNIESNKIVKTVFNLLKN